MTQDNIQKKFAEMLTPAHINLIQEYMNEHIVAGTGMPSKVIFAAIGDQLTVKDIYFSQAVSACIQLGKITGFEGRRRIGYVRVGDSVSLPGPNSAEAKAQRAAKLAATTTDGAEAPETTANDGKFYLQVTKNIRIAAPDKRNFTRQALYGGTWFNEAYYSNLAQALKATAKYLVNNKLRSVEATKDMRELKSLLETIEANILEEIKDHIGHVDVTAEDSADNDETNASENEVDDSDEHAA